jgi:membrane-associated phospholipid phosphatase
MQVQIRAKKTFLVVLFLLCALLSLNASRFKSSTALDLSLSLGSVGLVGGNFVWEKARVGVAYNGVPETALEDLNFLDKGAVFEYNATLDKISTLSTVALLIAPSALAFTDVDGGVLFTYGLMYAETVAMTYGLKELCKNLVTRERPYLYFDGYPSEELSNGDYCRSFLSGHTALAFASATYLTTVLSTDYKSSGFRIPVIAASYAVATAIASARVLSGNHYITDVLAGALLGSLCGVTVPLLHTLGNSDEDSTVSVHLIPAGLYVGVRV